MMPGYFLADIIFVCIASLAVSTNTQSGKEGSIPFPVLVDDDEKPTDIRSSPESDGILKVNRQNWNHLPSNDYTSQDYEGNRGARMVDNYHDENVAGKNTGFYPNDYDYAMPALSKSQDSNNLAAVVRREPEYPLPRKSMPEGPTKVTSKVAPDIKPVADRRRKTKRSKDYGRGNKGLAALPENVKDGFKEILRDDYEDAPGQIHPSEEEGNMEVFYIVNLDDDERKFRPSRDSKYIPEAAKQHRKSHGVNPRIHYRNIHRTSANAMEPGYKRVIEGFGPSRQTATSITDLSKSQIMKEPWVDTNQTDNVVGRGRKFVVPENKERTKLVPNIRFSIGSSNSKDGQTQTGHHERKPAMSPFANDHVIVHESIVDKDVTPTILPTSTSSLDSIKHFDKTKQASAKQNVLAAKVTSPLIQVLKPLRFLERNTFSAASSTVEPPETEEENDHGSTTTKYDSLPESSMVTTETSATTDNNLSRAALNVVASTHNEINSVKAPSAPISVPVRSLTTPKSVAAKPAEQSQEYSTEESDDENE